MEEELRAKALASMSVSSKSNENPSNHLDTKPSSDAKEEGELSSSSSSERDYDEEEKEEEGEQRKDQEMPATSAASIAAQLGVEPNNVIHRNKPAQGSSVGKCLPLNGVAGCVDKQLPTSLTQNPMIHFEMNPEPTRICGHHPGWYAPSDANDNLVITFSDDDSEGDSEEQKKERTSERKDSKIRLDRYKRPATSSQIKAKVLQGPPRKQLETMTKKVSSSRTFNSSMNKIHGPIFKGVNIYSVEQESPIPRHGSLNRSSASQEHGFIRGATYTALGRQIEKHQTKLKAQSKSMLQTKEKLVTLDGDCHGMKLDTGATRMSKSTSLNDPPILVSNERGEKRLKLDKHSFRKLKSFPQLQLRTCARESAPTCARESASRFRERVLENNCCKKDHNHMECGQCSRVIPVGTWHQSSNLQPDYMPSNQGDNRLSEAVMPGCCKESMNSRMQVGSLTLKNNTPSLSKLGASTKDGSSSLLKLSSPTKSMNAVGLGYTSLDIQSLVKLEEFHDKALEEAQDLRHRCENEERRALKAYRCAQRALLDANERCNVLYWESELLSAKLQASMMEDSCSRWSLGWNKHEETELDRLKSVEQATAKRLPSLNCWTQAHKYNMQYLPLNTCEPGASTSEPLHLHHKNNTAARVVSSPSNHPHMSADGDEEIFRQAYKDVQSHIISDKKREKLEERTVDIIEESDRKSFDESTQDFALLEASLRSKLFARLGMRNSSKNSGLCPNDKHCVDKGAQNDVENEKTLTSMKKLCVFLDMPLLETEQNQMADEEGLGRSANKNVQVPSYVRDQNHCDKFSFGHGYHRSTEPEESSSFKESFGSTCASVSSLPSSVPKILFRHVKVIAPDSCKVQQTRKGRKEDRYGILHKIVSNPSGYNSLVDVFKAHATSNCIGETRTGNFNFCDLAIDPFWPHCMFELRGKCNNEECIGQHSRDYSKRNARQLNDSSSSEGQVSPSALRKFTDARCLQHSPHNYAMPIPTYLVGTNLIKADTQFYGRVFARSVHQYWQWDFCTSFVVPFSIMRILPPDVPSLQAGEGCVKDHDRWNRLSLYFHNPDATMEKDKQGWAAAEQSLELALDLFNASVNKQEGKDKSLVVLSRALKVNPTFVLLWIFYIHIYYRKEKNFGKDDIFHIAVQHNKGSYELWLMFINSRMCHGDRLKAYHSALLTFCSLTCASKESSSISACVLDLHLQMVDFLCMSGHVEKVISMIYGLLSPAIGLDSPSYISLSDILRCLTTSNKCIFWVCCVYIVMYKKLPQAVVQRLEFEQELPLDLEWPPVKLRADEKRRALELMKMAIQMVTQETRGKSYERDYSNETALRSAHSLAISHLRCEAAIGGTESSKSLLDQYKILYPTCIELVLTSARWQRDNLGDDNGFERFEEALNQWPKEVPGVQCIWNQYAEFALENGRVTMAKDLMLRWFESVWKVQDLQSRILNGEENTWHSNQEDELFALINLSLHRWFQNDKVDALRTIDRALKLADGKDLKHFVREHAAFVLSCGPEVLKDIPTSEIPSLLLSYLVDVRFFPVSEPLSRKFLRSIKKPRLQQLVYTLLGPVSLDCSLMNSILKELYGSSLLPENLGELTDLIDFVEALMEILPANYQLAMSVCKLFIQNPHLVGIAFATIRFWASSLLVNSIFQSLPVAPEWAWLEAADILGNLEMWDIYERFHKQSVLVYPFSVKLWRSYYNLSKKTGNTNAVIDAASERGIKL